MALCLGESLLESRGFDPSDQMQLYLKWLDEGHWSSTGRCFDIGPTTRAALERFRRSGHPFSGSTDAMSAGNGSLMRLAPVVLYYASEPEKAIDAAADSSRTTHAAPAAVDACRYFAALLLGALRGEDKSKLLSANYSPIDELWERKPLRPEVADIANGSFLGVKAPAAEGGMAYVVNTLRWALWAFANTDDFKSGALAAVNLGGDADTTGAVYGQLAGAYYGLKSIPSVWRARITFSARIRKMATDLASASERHLS
jgi:ADP-ribosylglycohydrolase